MLRIVVWGLGAFLITAIICLFFLAEGASYLSDRPSACTNCHVMNDAYRGWQAGGHHHVAGCNSCHTPTGPVGKYYTKAMQGLRHSFYFTFQNFAEPIQISPANRGVVEQNCKSCHQQTIHLTSRVSESLSCIHCHQQVGHKR